MKKTITQFIVSSFLILVLIFGVGLFHANTALGDAPNTLKVATVSSGPTVTATSSDVLDASSGRVYAVFVNDGTVPIYLSLTGTKAAVADMGIRLNAGGGSYEIDLSNDYIGQVNAITASSTAVLTVTAFQ